RRRSRRPPASSPRRRFRARPTCSKGSRRTSLSAGSSRRAPALPPRSPSRSQPSATSSSSRSVAARQRPCRSRRRPNRPSERWSSTRREGALRGPFFCLSCRRQAVEVSGTKKDHRMADKKESDGERYLAEHRNHVPKKAEASWTAVDKYIGDNLLVDADPIFEAVLRANAAGGLPSIDVSPAQGKFLNLMVRI